MHNRTSTVRIFRLAIRVIVIVFCVSINSFRFRLPYIFIETLPSSQATVFDTIRTREKNRRKQHHATDKNCFFFFGLHSNR